MFFIFLWGRVTDTVCSGAAESQFSEATLREQLTLSSEMLERAERHELQVPLQRLLLPLLEARRDYSAMAAAFRHVAQSCARAAECATRSGKRLLGTYYRVAFYGQVRAFQYFSITYLTCGIFAEQACSLVHACAVFG
jgi:hypothetical protein